MVEIRSHGTRSGRTRAYRGSRDGRRCPTAGHGTVARAWPGIGRTDRLSPHSATEVDDRAATRVRSEGRSRRTVAEDD